MLKLYAYNKSMGKGEITSKSDREDDWDYPPPGSTFDIVYKKNQFLNFSFPDME